MFGAKIIKRKFICHYFLTILIADKRLRGFQCILIANGHILHNMRWWLAAMVKIYGVIGNIRAGYLKTFKFTNRNCDNIYEETRALHKF